MSVDKIMNHESISCNCCSGRFQESDSREHVRGGRPRGVDLSPLLAPCSSSHYGHRALGFISEDREPCAHLRRGIRVALYGPDGTTCLSGSIDVLSPVNPGYTTCLVTINTVSSVQPHGEVVIRVLSTVYGRLAHVITSWRFSCQMHGSVHIFVTELKEQFLSWV
jgi:hypothetical protein